MKTKPFLLMILCVTGFYSCFQYNPKKESNSSEDFVEIPEGAFRVKATKGNGLWVNVEYVHNHKNNAMLAIYDGNTGELIERKRFKLVCASNPSEFIWIEDLEKQIKVYDKGVFRFESDSCWLQ